jgi:hypothetical protein
VQLEHDQTEGEYQTHGKATVLYDAQILATHDSYQHNKNYRTRFDLNDELCEQVEEKLEALLRPQKPPSFIESEIRTRVEYEAWLKKTFPDFAAAARAA